MQLAAPSTPSRLELLRRVAINPYLCEIAYVYRAASHCARLSSKRLLMANLIPGMGDTWEILIAAFTPLGLFQFHSVMSTLKVLNRSQSVFIENVGKSWLGKRMLYIFVL